MEQNTEDVDEREIPMFAFRLMAQGQHRGIAAVRAAEKGHQKKHLFGNAPLPLFRLALIRRIHEKGQDRKHDQIHRVDQ